MLLCRFLVAALAVMAHILLPTTGFSFSSTRPAKMIYNAYMAKNTGPSPLFSTFMTEKSESSSRMDTNRKLSAQLKSQTSKELNETAHMMLQYINDDGKRNYFDHITISAAISACQRMSLYKPALDLFWALYDHQMPFDSVTLKSALRASALSNNIRQTIEILEISLRNRDEVLACLDTATESMAFSSAAKRKDKTVFLADMYVLRKWTEDHGFFQNAMILETFLFVYCKAQCDQQSADILKRLLSTPEKLSLRACTILMTRYSRKADEEKVQQLLQIMSNFGIKKDLVFYNTLLKIFVQHQNALGCLQLLEEMQSVDLRSDAITQSLIARLDVSTLAPAQLQRWTLTTSKQQPQQQSETAVKHSPAVLRNAYILCHLLTQAQDASAVRALLAEAEQTHIADTALYVAAASRLVELNKDYDKAFAVLETFLAQHDIMNGNLVRVATKFFVSAIQHNHNNNNIGISQKLSVQRSFVSRYLRFLQDMDVRFGFICDAATVQYVLSTLCHLQDPHFLLHVRRTHFAGEPLPTRAVRDTAATLTQWRDTLDPRLSRDSPFVTDTPFFLGMDRAASPTDGTDNNDNHTKSPLLISELLNYVLWTMIQTSQTLSWEDGEDSETTTSSTSSSAGNSGNNNKNSNSNRQMQQQKQWFGWNMELIEILLKILISNVNTSNNSNNNNAKHSKSGAKSVPYDSNKHSNDNKQQQQQPTQSQSQAVAVTRLFDSLRRCPSVRPSGVLLFEMSRFFRQQRDTVRSAQLLQWMSRSKKMLAPRSIVNAIVAYLYSEGLKHRAVTLYQRYRAVHYPAGTAVATTAISDNIRNTTDDDADVDDTDSNYDYDRNRNIKKRKSSSKRTIAEQDDWFFDPVDRCPTLDLHYKSRGLAYVILITSLKQIIKNSLFVGYEGIRIITGKNLSHSKHKSSAANDDEDDSDDNDNNDTAAAAEYGDSIDEYATTTTANNADNASGSQTQAFRLSDEVQQILIEEFFPPIPSSTEPGNPGRIMVRLSDIVASHAAAFATTAEEEEEEEEEEELAAE